MTTRRILIAAGAGLLAAPAVRAQGAWPNRPVRVIVPWPPGGSTDVLVRLYAEQLSPILGQPFVVENRAGAGGNIGLDAVAKSAPDGYTLGIASVGHLCINPTLYARLAYDPVEGLLPVGIAWDLPNVAVVAAEKNPARTLAEFITWAKAKPNGITYGLAGGRHHAASVGRAVLRARRHRGHPRPFRGAGTDRAGHPVGRCPISRSTTWRPTCRSSPAADARLRRHLRRALADHAGHPDHGRGPGCRTSC